MVPPGNTSTANNKLEAVIQKVDVPNSCAVELANCLWYLKTKFFRKAWESDSGNEDARARRALSRLQKGIESLQTLGVEVHDPVSQRYTAGSEATIVPIQFQPTPGVKHETITETVVPLVKRQGNVVQRAQVFVAVQEDSTSNLAIAGNDNSAEIVDTVEATHPGGDSEPNPDSAQVVESSDVAEPDIDLNENPLPDQPQPQKRASEQ